MQNKKNQLKQGAKGNSLKENQNKHTLELKECLAKHILEIKELKSKHLEEVDALEHKLHNISQTVNFKEECLQLLRDKRVDTFFP